MEGRIDNVRGKQTELTSVGKLHTVNFLKKFKSIYVLMKLCINCGIPNPNIKSETQTRVYLPLFIKCNWKL